MGSLQRFNLKKIRDVYNIDAFVETGTLTGCGVRLAIESGMNQIHSIEIDPEYYFRAVNMFRGNQTVSLHLGSSHQVLPGLLEHYQIQENTLFWLDAHFPLADKGEVAYNHETDASKRMPLLSELEAIVKHRANFNDVIIIDDLRCFVDDPRIRADSFDEHMRKLGARGVGCNRKDIVGIDLETILSTATNRYRHELQFDDEGYIILVRSSFS